MLIGADNIDVYCHFYIKDFYNKTRCKSLVSALSLEPRFAYT